MKIHRFPFLFAASFALVLFSGCSSSDDRPRFGHGPGGSSGQEAFTPVLLEGGDVFFDGSLKVVATISRGFDRPQRGGEGGEAGGGGRAPGGHWGGMGRHERREGGEMGGGGGDEPAPRVGESHMPPVRLRLRLENLSKAPLTVEIWQFKSELGDFAVRPDKLTVPAGATVEPDAMTSRLGLSSAAVPVQVELHVGGRSERRTLNLTEKAPPAPAAR